MESFDILKELEGKYFKASRLGKEALAFGNLYGASKSLLISGLIRRLKAPCLIITYDDQSAATLLDEITSILDQEKRFFAVFPDFDDYDLISSKPQTEKRISRLEILSAVLDEKAPIVIAPLHGALRRLTDPGIISENVMKIVQGSLLPLEKIVSALAAMGYRREQGVDETGTFAVKGDVLHVKLPGAPNPVRIDLLDDEIENISLMDPAAHSRVKSLDSIKILPVVEYIPRKQDQDLLRSLNKILMEARDETGPRYDPEIIERQRDHIETLTPFDGIEFYAARIFKTDLLDYFAGGFVFFEETERALRNAEKHIETQLSMVPKGFQGAYNPPQDLEDRLPENHTARFETEEILETSQVFESIDESVINLPVRPVPWEFRGIAGLRKLSEKNQAEKIIIYTKYYHQIEGHLLDLEGFEVRNIHESLYKGFVLEDRVLVLTDYEIFGDRLTSRGFTSFDGLEIGSLEELDAGNLVVHVHHGVGRFEGIKRIEAGGVAKDFFEITYAKGDKLFLPLNQISRIRRYLGADGDRPKLNRLGTNEWAKTREKVKTGLRRLAIDLLELYKERSRNIGFPFPSDTPWQHELETDFPYEETFDQLKAIDDVKADMETDRVMDRLLCGDVGYGKTEVGLRAAFKAVQAGKQTAVLVPTTILAMQHFNTFKDRMEKFHVKVEMLSRFRTAREQSDVIEKLAVGDVDILIGTHRLLQKDVKFRDIGLLIVDEEQRFGVEHKEKLKSLKRHIDVLTMTATPIPRTLQMSMVGVRDMSIIETPPRDRKAVRTYIMEYNESAIKHAIASELNRRGQVYYLYNKIEDIHLVEEKLHQLAPDATVAVAHGRMKEDSLEEIMYKFTQGLIDILLCTTIIENGMDIPNVNTLVVEGAEKLGLSQMYQLRGRVGRSSREAYAYFLHGPSRTLSDASKQRLEAIRDFTELGSGFRIAMRDLEIRGAGDLIGPEQHGFINSVGFDTYCEILSETINELKGLPVAAKFETVVDLEINTYIPKDFIPDSAKRAAVYRRMAVLDSIGEMNQFYREMLRVYHALPPEMENLFRMLRVKFLAEDFKITKLHSMDNGDTIRGLFSGPIPADEDDFEEINSLFSGRVRMDRERFFLNVAGLTQDEQLFYLKQLIDHLLNRFPPQAKRKH